MKHMKVFRSVNVGATLSNEQLLPGKFFLRTFTTLGYGTAANCINWWNWRLHMPALCHLTRKWRRQLCLLPLAPTLSLSLKSGTSEIHGCLHSADCCWEVLLCLNTVFLVVWVVWGFWYGGRAWFQHGPRKPLLLGMLLPTPDVKNARGGCSSEGLYH